MTNFVVSDQPLFGTVLERAGAEAGVIRSGLPRSGHLNRGKGCRAVRIAASFNKLDRSAPEKPGVRETQVARLTSGSSGRSEHARQGSLHDRADPAVPQ